MATTQPLISQETLPIYPVELVGGEEIHKYIPHLPVYITGDGDVTIPIGDHETSHIRLGLYVAKFRYSQSTFELKVGEGEAGETLFPNSIGLGKPLAGNIGSFILDINQRRRKAVKAYGIDDTPINLGRYSSHLLPYLTSAVRSAHAKRRNYLGL